MKTITTYQPFHFQSLSIQKGLEAIQTKNSLHLTTETGLGKTIVAATIALNSNASKVLVISPKANQKAWIDIMSKSGLEYSVSGNRAIPDHKDNFDLVIIDEVHKIGTVSSSTFQAVYKLVKYNQSKLIAISATPYNNNVESFIDILTLFNLPLSSIEFKLINVYTDKLTEYNYKLNLFRKLYGEDITKMSYKVIAEKAEAEFGFNKYLILLANTISTFTVRDCRGKIPILETEHLLERFPATNRKELHGFNPEYNVVRRTLDILKSNKFAWQNQLNYFLPEQNSEFGSIYRTTLLKLLESSKDAFIASVQKTISNIEDVLSRTEIVIGETKFPMVDSFVNDLNFDLKNYKELIGLWENVTESSKVDSLFSEIENNSGKFVVFTEYTETLNMLCREAEKRNIPFISFKNDTNEAVLDTITNEFDANNHKSDKYKLLICTDVLAEGVSLHYAKHLVHFDSRWNPSKTIQREGRINRICMDGNKHDICIYKFIVPPFINSEIELTEKVVRKESESEIILNNLNNDFENYLIDLDTIKVSSELETDDQTNFLIYNKKDYEILTAHFVNDTQFYLVSEDGKFIENNSKLTLNPFRPYQFDLRKEHSEQTVFSSFSEYVETAKKYPSDARFNGNYNINNFRRQILYYRTTAKTTRSNANKTEFCNFLNTKQFKEAINKDLINNAFTLMEHSFISYPMGFIWKSVKGKTLEDYIEAGKFMCELIGKIEGEVNNLIVRI